jgi:NAD(P)-dependent dehydrogenase (short-subunit alcohol dehydrogenase family)
MSSPKLFVIGGITGGIGSALARRLTAQGHRVAGFARNPEALERLSQSEQITTACCDATDADAIQQQLQHFTTELGPIDGYAHAIGSIFLKPAHLTSPEDWLQTLHLNLSSAFYALRAATKLMSKQGTGTCLFFSTAAAQASIANHEAIAAAKGGIEALVRSAAATYCSRGLRINAIAPSLTDTPLAKPIIASEAALNFSKNMHPLGEIGQADHVASLAAWLLSDEARFVTGQTYVMDGGISTIVPKPKA